MAYLDAQEVATLDELFVRAHGVVSEIRREAPVGSSLHAVKVPPRLTESIVAVWREEIFGEGTSLIANCHPHDLAVRPRRGRRLDVAVKGSGLTDWASITEVDRLAGVLVWVDYRARLEHPGSPVVVRVIPTRRLQKVGPRVLLGTLSRGCREFLMVPSPI